MFLSTYEKQMDSKRRVVVPMEFRALLSGPFEGVVCFPSIEAECLEAGGQSLYQRNLNLIDEFDPGDPLRADLETSLLAGMHRLSFDTAGRIILPDPLCEQFGLHDWIVIAGMGDRFQIWEREAYRIHRARARESAREGMAKHRSAQRDIRIAEAGR